MNRAGLSAAILRAAGAETIRAQNRPSDLWFKRHGVWLTALIANNIETFTFRTTTATLLWSTKVSPARIPARLAALRMTQSALAIIILFSFGKWEGVSTLGASDFHVWHSYLPRKPILRGGVVFLMVGSLPH